MPEISWKCFRCNLTFKNSEHAKLHEKLTKHKVSTVKTIVVSIRNLYLNSGGGGIRTHELLRERMSYIRS